MIIHFDDNTFRCQSIYKSLPTISEMVKNKYNRRTDLSWVRTYNSTPTTCPRDILIITTSKNQDNKTIKRLTQRKIGKEVIIFYILPDIVGHHVPKWNTLNLKHSNKFEELNNNYRDPIKNKNEGNDIKIFLV